MKIIGTDNNGQYVLTATGDEVAYISGHSSRSVSIIVGDTINVSAIYHRLIFLQEAEEDLDKAQIDLRRIADLLDPISQTIAHTLKEPGS